MAKRVQRQIVLPWSQLVRISFNSMRVRLFRSLITILTLVLAIAFVAYTRSGYEILNALWAQAGDPLRERILSSGYELSGGRFGSSPKDTWLASLSLLVCVVGIVNAQLMAVTERFREIGTFKCLGALDSFVVRLFILEALYQGLLGGVAGSVLGVVIATISQMLSFGGIVLLQWPLAGMLATLGETTLLAVLLSFVGVVYPAFVASRMQPAVALRSEQ